MSEVIQFELVGFIIVLGTLTALWWVCELVGLVFKRLAREATTASAPASTPTPVDVDEDEELAEHLPVIAAAVAATLDEPHQIIAVRDTSQVWSDAGRREHFASHRLRH